MGKIVDKLPRWEGEILEPPESKKDNGWLAGERPPFNWLNWLFNTIYISINTLDDDYGTHKESSTDVHGVGASSIESTEGSQQKVDNHAGEITGVHGVGASSVASEEYADSVAATAEQNAKSYANTLVVPPGAVLWFSGDTPPDGYLVCDGTYLSKTTYSDLFAVIGTTYGESGENFRLPDLRGEFVRGWDHGRGVDAGRVLGSWQEDKFKSHNHQFYVYNENAEPAARPGNTSRTDEKQSVDTTYTGSSETRPRNVALLPCIKY
ncbi:hypothetical protein GM661_00595 [Iocasia frigidifontis]|uniref:Phage tail collar domain-containing protein n=1 Tax=Iocasia fonsfrigidae TaxID=2682810 RepID=A0A8A7KFC0_9FIRM|nr:phage tail protein [Iocasia fonsfrigidae]QTL96572.1 hypothetical protein GM661_00595 [Iocasia fonsfrigidae]